MFVRKVCHDLRAPIRALMELPGWLAADLRDIVQDVPEHIRETVDMMQLQAGRLDEMIVGLSELVKLRREEERAQTELSDLLAQLDLPVQLNLRVQIDALPMEAAHVELVIGHLVENAYRHGGRQDVRVQLEITLIKGYFCITVTDDGVGMSEEDLEVVYEPLTTLRPRDEVEGSGMGLAVVARVAELYNGRCQMLRNPHGGVTSLFAIPDVDPVGAKGAEQ